MKRYFIAKAGSNISNLGSYTTYGSILNWISFSIDEKDYDSLMSFDQKINEVSKDIAVFGMRSFGDIRNEIKVSVSDVEENTEFEDIPSLKEYEQNSFKVKIPVTEKRYTAIVSTMKLIAKLIIEDVFDKKFVSLDYNVSSLEKKCWQYQVQEDKQFIENIAEIKEVSTDDLKESINYSKNQYDNEVKKLYLSMVNLKQKFYNCKTINELNILFEDYMGLPMPQRQAVEEGRYIDMEDGNPPVRKEVIPGFKF